MAKWTNWMAIWQMSKEEASLALYKILGVPRIPAGKRKLLLVRLRMHGSILL
jgi:hypothetical protein